MAGHSKFANIKHRKGAQDAKRAKLFTKLQREITVAAKTGNPDPEFNPRLRTAIIAAKGQNMPKDRIDNAVKKATSSAEGDNYEEMRYEGYGTASTALIISALTDNRNRTASDVRSAFTKHGGNLGESGSVSYLFNRVGVIIYSGENIASEDEIFEVAVEAGAQNVESFKDEEQEFYEITTEPEDLEAVREVLAKKYGDPEVIKLDFKAITTNVIDNVDTAKSLMKLIDTLEDNDDVQSVVGNYEIPDEIMKQL